MDHQRTPTNLLNGRLWAGWGPRVEAEFLTDAAVELVARRTGRDAGQVGDIMLHSEDRGRYVLLTRLSVTGHAAVYAGVDRVLARDVAVKVHRDGHRHATQRAILESQAMALLDHPNVVQIYDLGEQDMGDHGAWLYSVMELCDCDLQSWHLGVGWADIVLRILEAAQGLSYLHELGYAHGDIKPLNILIRNSTAKLADFGHARKVGSLFVNAGGTVGYMAPDVLDHGSSFAGDVFALAVTTWVCLFGNFPYSMPQGDRVSLRGAMIANTQRALDREIDPPKKIPPGLPGSIRSLLEVALDPDPRLRPPLDEFIRVLRRALDQDERRRRRLRRLPAIAVGSAALMLLGFSIGVQRARETGAGTYSSVLNALSNGNPLIRAEAAASRGDIDGAMGALYRLDADISKLSVEDRLSAAETAERIAFILERQGAQDDARRAWTFAVHLYEAGKRPDKANSARQARDRTLNSAPDGSK